MSGYDGLTDYLVRRQERVVELTLEQIEAIVGHLPASAHKYNGFWANSSNAAARSKYWITAGRRAQPDLSAGLVRFHVTEKATDAASLAEGLSGFADATYAAPAARRHQELESSGEVSKTVLVFEWLAAGTSSLAGHRLVLPELPPRAGVYRLCVIRRDASRSTYLGDTGDLAARMFDYRHPHPATPSTVHVHELVCQTLNDGGAVRVDVVLAALCRGEGVDLAIRSARRMVKAVALHELAEDGDDVDDLHSSAAHR